MGSVLGKLKTGFGALDGLHGVDTGANNEAPKHLLKPIRILCAPANLRK
jgi:hypothetical protein